MAESEADIGYGVALKKESAPSSGTYTDFGLELTSVDVPSISQATQDATHMASPDQATELIYGLYTSKPFNCEFNWIKANTQDIIDELTGDPANWQMDFGDNVKVVVKGKFTDFTIGGLTPDGKKSATATFTPKSGIPVWSFS